MLDRKFLVDRQTLLKKKVNFSIHHLLPLLVVMAQEDDEIYTAEQQQKNCEEKILNKFTLQIMLS